MRRTHSIPVWKSAPFIRFLLPFMGGIILQWYAPFSLLYILTTLASFIMALGLFRLLPLAYRFKWKAVQGFTLHLVFVALGLLITWQKDIRHADNWYGNYYHDSDYLVVRIDEPLIGKEKSYKAQGIVESILHNRQVIPCTGKLLVYFSKDDTAGQLQYGDKILISKNLQAIKNSGNPGAFNYKQYAAFQGIFHNVYLKSRDWIALDEKNVNGFKQFIFRARESILSVLRKNINSDKDALGIAEALLIGYTNDLDKDLVQAYSNTGVVHIIAISGMHLALIYLLLVGIFKRIPLINRSKIVQVVLILSCLWLFSLLTGAAASVLRSAVMFTFITIGKNFFKRSSIYNSLAAAAFVMLCYDPYFLWDVGFQLSYLAVVGIIIFQKPVYNLLYIKNKWIDKVWELAAVSLAAQVLTFPVCIYYFHQFPTLFLFVNILVVPLSSFILYAEIALFALAWIPFLAPMLGRITAWLVGLMNMIILKVNALSFAVWDKIPATALSTWILYALVISTCTWLLKKNKRALYFSLACLLTFTMLQDHDKWQQETQQKIIVYNVPQHKAVDLVYGNAFMFIGDSILKEDGVLRNFHIRPARIALQLNAEIDTTHCNFKQQVFYQFGDKRIGIIDKAIIFEPVLKKIDIDMIIISKNPKLYIPELAKVFNCRQYIFDASNSLWKIAKWQKDCEALHLQCYSIPEQGGFVSDL